MRRKHRRAGDESEINVTPMLDIVFIMLIFFIVTTSFVKEVGIDVNRPSDQPEQEQPEPTDLVLIKILGNGQVMIDNRQINVRAVEANVQNALAAKPDASVVVSADEAADSGILVEVIDQARLAGAESVSIATESAR